MDPLPRHLARARVGLAEIAATNAKLDTLSLVLDSDLRRVTTTGSAQTSYPAELLLEDAGKE